MKLRPSLVAVLALCVPAVAASAADFRGIVKQVDLDKKQIVVEGREKGVGKVDLTFVLGQESQILFGRQPGELREVATGRRVRVHYEMSDDKRLISVLAVTGPRPTRTAANNKTAASAENTIAGLLRRVALTDREIVVIGKDGKTGKETETTLEVPKDAKVVRNQKAVKFDVLQEGEQVRVRVEKRGDKLMAVAITIGAEPPTATAIDRARQVLRWVDWGLGVAKQLKEMKR
jgi:hypothetical protein